ncbi:hypothetical protein GUITHDRAFT_141511 [Guillardia theta CCMP2712]|uniref:Uncharacterized protein n=2 Tax=Guillardia theta TaxID=55529 RepID=L1J0H6_GUITC|nr:hypothetical protein GUITHDRAFT_141511 [Guillardia theta CCMP2712]EKX42038.1 hypothetical protein GUITHDRAFT_141511 [Guillardia theta CCMP2712]|eukprot:XP_005829018.1 hypothetical protein GUITHDRAFT_141511 [Guillardia theta CCMP2712]
MEEEVRERLNSLLACVGKNEIVQGLELAKQLQKDPGNIPLRLWNAKESSLFPLTTIASLVEFVAEHIRTEIWDGDRLSLVLILLRFLGSWLESLNLYLRQHPAANLTKQVSGQISTPSTLPVLLEKRSSCLVTFVCSCTEGSECAECLEAYMDAMETAGSDGGSPSREGVSAFFKGTRWESLWAAVFTSGEGCGTIIASLKEPRRFASSMLRKFTMLSRNKIDQCKQMQAEQLTSPIKDEQVDERNLYSLADWRLLASTFENMLQVGPLPKRNEKIQMKEKMQWYSLLTDNLTDFSSPGTSPDSLTLVTHSWLQAAALRCFWRTPMLFQKVKMKKMAVMMMNSLRLSLTEMDEFAKRKMGGGKDDICEWILLPPAFHHAMSSLGNAQAFERGASLFLAAEGAVRKKETTEGEQAGEDVEGKSQRDIETLASSCPTCCHLAKSLMSLKAADGSGGQETEHAATSKRMEHADRVGQCGWMTTWMMSTNIHVDPSTLCDAMERLHLYDVLPLNSSKNLAKFAVSKMFLGARKEGAGGIGNKTSQSLTLLRERLAKKSEAFPPLQHHGLIASWKEECIIITNHRASFVDEEDDGSPLPAWEDRTPAHGPLLQGEQGGGETEQQGTAWSIATPGSGEETPRLSVSTPTMDQFNDLFLKLFRKDSRLSPTLLRIFPTYWEIALNCHPKIINLRILMAAVVILAKKTRVKEDEEGSNASRSFELAKLAAALLPARCQGW